MLSQLYLAKKEFDWKYNFIDSGRLILFSLGIVFISSYLSSFSSINWYVGFFLSLIGGFILALILGLLNMKFAFDFLKNKI